MLTVRPPIKAAVFLTCLVTLAVFYFHNTPFPFFLTRLKQALLTAAILWSAGGWGMRSLQVHLLKTSSLTSAESLLFAETLGLGWLSLLMVLLGTLSGWIPQCGWLLIGAGAAMSRPFLNVLRGFYVERTDLTTPSTPFTLPQFAVWTGGLLSLILALAPITYYDSLVYHLALPAAYLRAHHWVALPGLIYSAFPQTVEMLWSLALLIGDDTVVNLLGWSLGMLLIASVISYARRFLDFSVGWVGAASLVLMPAFLLLSSGGYIDLGLTFFGFMAIYAISLWNEKRKNTWVIMAGLCAGWTVGCKYTGALVVGLIALGMGISLYRQKGPRTWKPLFLFIGTALIIFAPWMIKNTIFVGNPVFPFFQDYGIKTLNPWVPDAASGYFAGVTEYYSRPLSALPGVLWEMAVNGIAFGRGIDVLGDFGWTPLIVLLPAIWLCAQRPPAIWFLLVFSGCFFVCWAMSRPVFRFLPPMSPLWALLAAYGWVHGVRTAPLGTLWVTRGILGTFLLSGLFLFFYTLSVSAPWGAALGLESKPFYLSRMLNYYSAADFVNTQIPENSRVYVMGDQRGYYYERDVWITPVFSKNPLTEWANTAHTGRELHEKLKSEGITHIVTNRTEWERLAQSYPNVRLALQGQKNWEDLQAHFLKPLYHDRACDVYAL